MFIVNFVTHHRLLFSCTNLFFYKNSVAENNPNFKNMLRLGYVGNNHFTYCIQWGKFDALNTPALSPKGYSECGDV